MMMVSVTSARRWSRPFWVFGFWRFGRVDGGLCGGDRDLEDGIGDFFLLNWADLN